MTCQRPAERAVPAADDWKKHWAFRPVQRPPVPKVKDAQARNPIEQGDNVAAWQTTPGAS